jgi:hypothetical protein
MTNQKQHKRFSSYGRLGLLLTVVGILLAVDSLAKVSYIYKFWPLLGGIVGCGFVGIHVRRGRPEALYVTVGVYLIAASALTLYCSLSSWAAMSGLWPLFITFLGVAFCFGYLFGKRSPFLLLAGLLLVTLSAVFFFVLIVNPRLWWIVLVLAGASFVVYDRARSVS